MSQYKTVIPKTSKVYTQLLELVTSTQIVIFSGLPGVGKSLYINEFKTIAKAEGHTVDLIQWDVARKGFETPFVKEHFPMGEGTVHNGLKLMAGQWLIDEVELWADAHLDTGRILLIEAPLVGHRFVELIKPLKNTDLEAILASESTKVVMPIPSKKVRTKIEEERARQVSEEAKAWSGAKPSVMLMLWKMTCGIANELGMDIDMSGQPEYSPSVYEYVFSVILKHRHFEPLMIEEIFEVPPQDESALHDGSSFLPDSPTADHYAQLILDKYTTKEIDEVVEGWYLN